MTRNNKMEEDLQFVAHHFKEGALLPSEGWRRFRLTHNLSTFRRHIAAASIAAVVLAATASIYYYSSNDTPSQAEESVNIISSEAAVASDTKTAKIEFHNAPLTDVIAEIERVYGVRIIDIPEDQILVTISYEGTASDVVETINELFDTNLKIATKAN